MDEWINEWMDMMLQIDGWLNGLINGYNAMNEYRQIDRQIYALNAVEIV